jgi:hypothetical protein
MKDCFRLALMLHSPTNNLPWEKHMSNYHTISSMCTRNQQQSQPLAGLARCLRFPGKH